MIPADLLAMLRCPLTGQTLTWASPDVLARVNAHGGWAGATAEGENPIVLDAALVRADGAVLYPVSEGIPILLAEQAIAL